MKNIYTECGKAIKNPVGLDWNWKIGNLYIFVILSAKGLEAMILQEQCTYLVLKSCFLNTIAHLKNLELPGAMVDIRDGAEQVWVKSETSCCDRK